MKFNIWVDCPKVALTELLSFIVDNRGKTVPTSTRGWKLIATNCVTNNTLYPVYEGWLPVVEPPFPEHGKIF